jgi:hypothetical protein
MTITADPSGEASAAPDALDVLCTMCEYDLRGLTEARCPECGFTFDWPDLIDPTRRKHKYLFEHHPDHNGWSFIRTAIGGLLPRRFWRSLRPEQPSNVRRLIAYWLLTVWGVFVPLAGYVALTCVFEHSNNVPARARIAASLTQPADVNRAIEAYGSVGAYLDWHAPVAPGKAFFGWVWARLDPGPFAVLLTAAACFVLLPWIAAASLMLFQATMRRTRVRTAHVLRCCLYSFDGGWWFGLLSFALLAGVLFELGPNLNLPRLLMLGPVIIGCAAAAMILLGIVKLLLAYRLYMRFPQAITTVLIALSVGALALVTLVSNVPSVQTALVEMWYSM